MYAKARYKKSVGTLQKELENEKIKNVHGNWGRKNILFIMFLFKYTKNTVMKLSMT